MSITKIVVTGGPCAGKSTALSRVHDEFEAKGYKVYIVNETATELINGGIAPWNCVSQVEFQKLLINLQLHKERIFDIAAKNSSNDKIIILYDRGALDCKAYVSEIEFYQILKYTEKNEIELRDGYDAVFHLVSAAKGAEKYYTVENNCARTETISEAASLDDKIIESWTGHPHLRIIDNSTDFNEKINRLINEIALFLGEPEPLEIERKFLIEYPDVKWLEDYPACKKIEIKQTYLISSKDEECRVRRRGSDGHYVYTLTVKKQITGLKRIEEEKRISFEEYNRYLLNADTSKNPIEKTRYCLTYDNNYFEIDVYPFWSDKAIVEIELNNENAKVNFPDKIKVIKEVTEDPKYKNHSLSMNVEL